MLSLLLAAALEFTAQDAQLAYEKACELVENCTPRDAGTIRGRIAANRILDEASAAGADVRRDAFKAQTPKGEKEFTNLYAEFKSSDPSARWVVLVSHYDTKSGVSSPGANDGASTSGLLIGLANAFANWEQPKGNLMLVWADGEECMTSYGPNDGFWGSKRAAAYLEEKGYKVQAVICLDMLGDKDLKISIPPNVSMDLAKKTVAAAKRLGLKRKQFARFDSVVLDDHVAFKDAGFKAIDLIDFEYGSKPGLNDYWHTSRDTQDKLSADSFLTVGRLVCEILSAEEKSE